MLEVVRQHIEAAYWQVLPRSQLAKTCKYILSPWDKLTRFLEYSELKLSNNLAELDAPGRVGRRNRIHIGSLQAGPKIAAILSVVESYRQLEIPVRDYLAAVLPGAADLATPRVAERTPRAWAK